MEGDMWIRGVAGLSALGAAANAGLAAVQRSMIGFPDGARGPADALLDPLLLVVIVVSSGVAIGSAGLTVLSVPPRIRIGATAVVAGIGGLAIAVGLAAEPVLKGLYPSTGG